MTVQIQECNVIRAAIKAVDAVYVAKANVTRSVSVDIQ